MSRIVIAFCGSKTMTLKESFVISKMPYFSQILLFMFTVSYMSTANNLILPKPDISSQKGSSIFTYLLSLGVIISLCTGKGETTLIWN